MGFERQRALALRRTQSSESVTASRKPRARSIVVRSAVMRFVMVKRGENVVMGLLASRQL
jgi:hypothetical protein